MLERASYVRAILQVSSEAFWLATVLVDSHATKFFARSSFMWIGGNNFDSLKNIVLQGFFEKIVI